MAWLIQLMVSIAAAAAAAATAAAAAAADAASLGSKDVQTALNPVPEYK